MALGHTKSHDPHMCCFSRFALLRVVFASKLRYQFMLKFNLIHIGAIPASLAVAPVCAEKCGNSSSRSPKTGGLGFRVWRRGVMQENTYPP